MPQSTLSASRVLSMVGRPASRDELESALFNSKAEVSEWENDQLSVEVTPDRLDLLSEGGLGLYLQGALGTRSGLLTPSTAGAASVRIDIDGSVEPLRPVIGGAVVVPPKGSRLDDGLLAEAIRFQEILHATVGADRRLASLGIYPIDRIQPTIRYSLEPLDQVRFVPLDEVEAVDGTSFFARHPLAQKFGAYGRDGDRCLVLRDASGEILSLPPVLNSRGAGEARAGDGELLIESTGVRAGRVADALGLMILPFVARGWDVAPVRLEGHLGPSRPSEGWAAIRSIRLRSSRLAEVAGESYPAGKIEHWVAASRLGIHPEPHGYRVEVPPWRPDVLAEADIIEEAILARGVRPEDGLLPPGGTRGRRLPESRFRRRVGELLRGAGYTEVYTPVLVSQRSVALAGRADVLEVTNPVSDQYARLRDRLQLSLQGVLERNVRHGYPQRFAEVGPVVVRSDRAESGGETRYHAGAILAADVAGFAEGASLLDYLIGAFGARGVREPSELPGTIPGRAARVKIAGDSVAEVGELHPELLTELRVPVPAVWVEVDLSALWPLVRREAGDL